MIIFLGLIHGAAIIIAMAMMAGSIVSLAASFFIRDGMARYSMVVPGLFGAIIAIVAYVISIPISFFYWDKFPDGVIAMSWTAGYVVLAGTACWLISFVVAYATLKRRNKDSPMEVVEDENE